MAARLRKLGSTLWEHKKKSIFAAACVYWASRWAQRKHKNNCIRKVYALQARAYGDAPISAEDRCRRVLVLANVMANERACYDDFTTNALPLLNLAGLEVNVIKADSEAQLEALAGAIDQEEADAIFVVGGDGTLGTVLTGILRNRDRAVLPIGVFPGGYDNLTLKRLVPLVFEEASDIRRQCESAMALIEDIRRPIYPMRIVIDGSDEQPRYSVGDVGAGWFRHIEDKRKKFWYYAGAKRRFAYLWEMLKRSPEDLECAVEWQEYCSGCNRCRTAPIQKEVPWRWWHVLTGTPRIVSVTQERDFSKITNERCDTGGSLVAKGTELIINAEQQNQDEAVGLRLLIGGEASGRLGTISEGWSRCAANVVHRSVRDSFYSTDVFARAFVVELNRLPDFVRKIFVSSSSISKDPIPDGFRIRVEAVDSRVELFLPSALRVDPNTV